VKRLRCPKLNAAHVIQEIILQFSLRPANYNDVALLARMNKQLIQDEHSRNTMSHTELADRITRWLDDGRSIIIVERDDDAIGYLVYYGQDEKYYPYENSVYVRQYFIQPRYRRRGIGQVAFERIAKEYFPPHAAIMLDVLHTNPEAKAFWMKLGFDMYCVTLRRD
jgi:GNAT superfamily N-acetyltransferase